jgi:hypothetical protein
VGSIRVAWWNLENLFDTVDDPISRDFDFTPSEGWTATAYKAKKQNLAAALNELHGGLGAELLGVAEVEGDTVFEELIAETGNTHLKVVKDPSGTSDLRGIDVSLAYDDRKLSVVDKHSHVVHLRYQTRDIFEVVFKVKDTNEEFVVIASHWPSRRHGRLESEPLRIAVAENIAFLVRDHVRLDSVTYEQLRAQNKLGPVEVREGNRRLPGRRHLPLQRLLALSRTREPWHLLHHLNPSRRGLPQPVPSPRPDHLHPRTAQTNRAPSRPDQHRYPPHAHRRDSLGPAAPVPPQYPQGHLRPSPGRGHPRLLTPKRPSSRRAPARLR